MLKRKYFKNYILCGEILCYCLLCKSKLTLQSIQKHLKSSSHTIKKVKKDYRVPQFSKECIFKIDPYYYCSLCNITVQDIPQIKQHIASETHNDYKTDPGAALTRIEVNYNNEDLSFNIGPNNSSTSVGHCQWNGIIDKTCVFCYSIGSNIGNHMHSTEHSIKLIQARVQCIGDHYFRKTGANTFQCFTCELAYPMSSFDDHFMNHSNNNSIAKQTNKFPEKNGVYGKPLFDCCIKDGNVLNDKIVLCDLCMLVIYKTAWDIELFSGIEDDYLEIDENAKEVICKTCKRVVKTSACELTDHFRSHYGDDVIYSNFRVMMDRYTEKHYIRIMDHGAFRSKAAKFARMNYIKMNAGGSMSYCMLCDKYMSVKYELFKTHVAGKHHQGHLELKGVNNPAKHIRGNYMPIPMYKLMQRLSYSGVEQSFLIDRTLLMPEDSFFLMKRISFGKHYWKTKCFACDEYILQEDEKEHCISWKHKSNFLGAECIIQGKPFIRKIRPKLYHCGLCNASLPYWESMISHCRCINHLLKTIPPDALDHFAFPKQIKFNTDKDNIYMQLLNAVFKTKYVINLD